MRHSSAARTRTAACAASMATAPPFCNSRYWQERASRSDQSGLRAPFQNVEVRGVAVEAFEHGARCGWHVAHRVIRAHEALHGIQTLEPHQRRELHFALGLAAQ